MHRGNENPNRPIVQNLNFHEKNKQYIFLFELKISY